MTNIKIPEGLLEGIYEIERTPSKSSKLGIDVKDVVYKELIEKAEAIDFGNMSKEEEKIMETMRACSSLSVKKKSLLPEETYRKIKQLEEKERRLLSEYTILPELKLISSESFENFAQADQEILAEIKATVAEAAEKWDEIENEGAEWLERVSQGALSIEECAAIISRKIPSKEAFVNSYECKFRYKLTPIAEGICFGNEAGVSASSVEYYCEIIENVQRETLWEVVLLIDSMLFRKENVEKKLLPRKTVGAAKKKLEALNKGLGNETIASLVDDMQEILDSEDFLICDLSEDAAYKILRIMLASGYLDEEKLDSLDYLEWRK